MTKPWLTPAGSGANPLRVVLYARYSSDRQSEHSIEDQIRICRAHAEQNGWQVVQTFQDAAISGSTMLRPGYQALQVAMRGGEVDVVLAEALDRFSRDQEHVAAFYKLAAYHRVRLVTLSEGEVSVLHVGLKGTMNALYLEDLAAKTRRGLEGRVRAGRATGPAPYGYRRVTHVLRADGEIDRGLREIIPEQAAVVRRIFEEYAAGVTPGVLARRLNAEGIAAPRGKGWTAMTLRGRPSHADGILRNRAYLGEICWNRRHRVIDPQTGQHHRRLNPLDQRVTGEIPELRLIEQQLWDQVQQRLADAAPPQDAQTGATRFWEKRSPRHLLSGKIICGACGGPFAANTGGRYSCNNVPRGLCDHRRTVRRKPLEHQVLAVLAESMMEPALAEAFAETFATEWNQLAGEQGQVRTKLQKELDVTERKLGNMLEAIAEGLRSAGLQAKLSSAEAEAERLRLAIAQAVPPPIRLMPNLGVAYRHKLAHLRESLAAGDNPQALEAARALIARVTIQPGPAGEPLTINVEGHLAQMLVAAQPSLPPSAANALALAADRLPAKERQRGRAPRTSRLPALRPGAHRTRPLLQRG